MIEEGKGYSLGRKADETFNNLTCHNPGPGTYEVSEKIEAPKLGGYMGRKTLKKKKNTQ